MKKTNKKTYFNDIALKVAHKVLKIPYLHYGYFPQNLTPRLENLPEAQELYVEKILSLLPLAKAPLSASATVTSGALASSGPSGHRMIDIGCGVGSIAEKLLKMGYQVTCIDPNPYMIESAQARTQNKIQARNDFYENVEDLQADSHDLILMSESCQYVNPEKAWSLHKKYLRQKGLVVIADFFKIKELDHAYLSKSGHEWTSFLKIAEDHNFILKEKIDITKEVSPTMDIYQSLILEKIFPVIEGLFQIIERKHPWLYKGLACLFKNKILKIKEKYSHQDGKTFSEYKAYYLLLFEKK